MGAVVRRPVKLGVGDTRVGVEGWAVVGVGVVDMAATDDDKEDEEDEMLLLVGVSNLRFGVVAVPDMHADVRACGSSSQVSPALSSPSLP